jgi:photosystem II stability/assembly factor-like uncharacterized protein
MKRMSDDVADRTILVATAGQGILRSNDDGTSWLRLGISEAIEFDGVVRALAVDPSRPERVYAGADCGFCISDDGGAHWRRADSSINGLTVWSIAVDPSDSRVIFAGTGAPSRAALFRSRDAGESWTRLGVEFPEFCAGVNRPRLLTISVDPDDGQQVWFGVEEGGAWRTRDAGDSWERVDGEHAGIRNSDIHAISIIGATASSPKAVLVLTVNCVHRSVDDGLTWEGELSRDRFEGLYYTRTVMPLPGSEALLLAVGDGTPGRRTQIYRSNDRAKSWSAMQLETVPNSTVWVFGAHSSAPQLVFAGTKYGDLFRSRDSGTTWSKEWRAFSEITAVAWTPFKAPLVSHVPSDR